MPIFARRAIVTDTWAKHVRWDDIELEKMRGSVTKRFVNTQQLMLAQVNLKKGDDVPRHSHHNEQFTYVISGRMEFWLGAADEQNLMLRAGEVLLIPGNLPHRAYAHEDTFELDIFNPPRQDWIDKTDDYLRK
jgi:quercetin dioxygenase-like cupin family protein